MKNIITNIVFLFVSVVGFAGGIPNGSKLILTKINGKSVEQNNIYLTIDTEKQIIFGNSGCNNFSLNYTSKNNSNCIKTKIPMGTLMACEQTTMEAETNFINTIKERKIKIKTTKNKILFKNRFGKTIMELKVEN